MKSIPSFLGSLHHQYLVDAHHVTPLDKVINAYLHNATLDSHSIENCLKPECLPQTFSSPWELIEKWREILSLILILHDHACIETYRSALEQHLERLSATFLWDEFQLLSAYRALSRLLLGLPSKEPSLYQLPSGACPLEAGGHWLWAEIPHPAFHCELGILWCLYAHFSGNQSYAQAAERLAAWQLYTLSHNYSPFTGLFSQEGDASDALLLANNYILFKAIAHLFDKPTMLPLADRQLAHLKKSIDNGGHCRLSGHTAVFERWLGGHSLTEIADQQAALENLPHAFEDIHLAMAGCRSDQESVVATLFGGGSGMGCFHRQSVQIVNFGPQHLPLGDCRGFGIEGAARLLESRLKCAKATPQAFSVEGITRMAPKPKISHHLAGFRHGESGGVWIDAKLNFKQSQLAIQVDFQQVFDQEAIAFVFFGKGQSCLVNKELVVKPRSFQHYHGPLVPIQLQGSHDNIFIEAGHQQGELRVIPLGGGENFWGADFLVAYLCPLNQKGYSWQIR